jgi:hypothetical protein
VESVIHLSVALVGLMLPQAVLSLVQVAHQVTAQMVNSVFHPLPVMRFNHSFVELILKMQQPHVVCHASQAKASNVQTERDVLHILFAMRLD